MYPPNLAVSPTQTPRDHEPTQSVLILLINRYVQNNHLIVNARNESYINILMRTLCKNLLVYVSIDFALFLGHMQALYFDLSLHYLILDIACSLGKS